MEETLTYWQQFVVIYDLIKLIGFIGIQYLLGAIFIFGILRSIYKYAGGHSIGKPTHSVWTFRFFDWVAVTFFATTTEFLDNDGNSSDPFKIIPVGFNLLGILLDILCIGVIISLSILVWPFVVFASLTFVPLQLCRNRNLRKRKFIAELKGEELTS